MEELPDDVVGNLLRGLGTYINSTPANELPREVRRFHGFRPAALRQHRDAVLSLLESEAQRGLVLEWLDEGRPPLSRAQTAALRVACVRADGWSEELAAMSRPAPKKKQQPASDSQALLRERAKTRKAREEARAAKAELDALTARHTTELADAERAVAALRDDLEAQRKATERIADELEAARATSERELRRARSRLKSAEEEAKQLRTELRQLQPALVEEPAPAPPPRRAKKPRQGPRNPLKVPRGRRDDEIATLEGWLSRDDVHLLIDGYNVTMVGYPGLALEAQRVRLVAATRGLAARHAVPMTIVFDGAEGTGVYPRTGKVAVRVVFSKGRIADDTLIEILEGLPPTPVIVVTNDRELRGRAAELGATIATSEQLLALLP